jgi:hypothetical protein
MKKYFFVIILSILVSTFISCLGKFSVVRDGTLSNSKYLRTRMYSGIMNKRIFQEFKDRSRMIFIDNRELSAEQKKSIMSTIDKMQYEDNKYLYFTMISSTPYLPDELNFKFYLNNENGSKTSLKTFLVPTKWELITNYGSEFSYNYTYALEANNPLTNETKINLSVDMPDGSQMVYKVK